MTTTAASYLAVVQRWKNPDGLLRNDLLTLTTNAPPVSDIRQPPSSSFLTVGLIEQLAAKRNMTPEQAVVMANQELNKQDPTQGTDPYRVTARTIGVLMGAPAPEMARWAGPGGGGMTGYANQDVARFMAQANRTFQGLNGSSLGFGEEAPAAASPPASTPPGVGGVPTGYIPPTTTPPVDIGGGTYYNGIGGSFQTPPARTPATTPSASQFVPSSSQVDALLARADFTNVTDVSAWLSQMSGVTGRPLAFSTTPVADRRIVTEEGEVPEGSQRVTDTVRPASPTGSVSILAEVDSVQGGSLWANFGHVDTASLLADPRGNAVVFLQGYLGAQTALAYQLSRAGTPTNA